MADAPALDDRERVLDALLEAGDIERATERAIQVYGPELIGWLCSILPNEADAQDAFSRMSEQLWRSLPSFDRRCSMRTWCYMLARQAASRVRTGVGDPREVLHSHIPSILGAVAQVWSTSRAGHQQAENVYAEIRRSLEDDDQTLLVLRVDRNLSWREIAIVLMGEEADPEAINRKAATLRKQFERIKERLRELAAEKLQH